MNIKKFLIGIAASAIVFGSLAASAFAKGPVTNTKAPFYTVDSCSSDQVTDTIVEGKVILVTPMGSKNLIMEGSVKGLNPDNEYHVWVRNLKPGYTGDDIFNYDPLGYYKLTTLVTDKEGNGNFHINFSSSELAAGVYPIQVAINTASDTYGCTVVATSRNTFLSITVN